VTSFSRDVGTTDGWHSEPVEITASAGDRGTTMVSGVDEIRTAVEDGGFEHVQARTFEEGVHRLHGSAIDMTGNVEPKTTEMVRVDESPPQPPTFSASGPEGDHGWFQGDTNVEISAVDRLSGVDRIEYRIDGGPWLTYDGPIEVTGDGIHTVEARATDTVGHESEVAAFEVKIDATPPAAQLDRPTDGRVYLGDMLLVNLFAGPAYLLTDDNVAGSEFTIEGFGSDLTSGLDELGLRLDNASFLDERRTSPASWTWDTDGYTSGLHELSLLAEDRAGNVERIDTRLVLGSATEDGIEETVDEGPARYFDR
jgi:hypothetical protein